MIFNSMAGTTNRHGEHSCNIVSKYLFEISQRKPDLIIEPHDGGVPKVIWDHRSPHTSPPE